MMMMTEWLNERQAVPSRVNGDVDKLIVSLAWHIAWQNILYVWYSRTVRHLAPGVDICKV